MHLKKLNAIYYIILFSKNALPAIDAAMSIGPSLMDITSYQTKVDTFNFGFVIEN